MYIVAIAWLYVTVLMAATEPSITAGVLTFLFYGLLPCALFVWIFGAPQRNRNRQKTEAQSTLEQRLGEPDRTDAQHD